MRGSAPEGAFLPVGEYLKAAPVDADNAPVPAALRVVAFAVALVLLCAAPAPGKARRPAKPGTPVITAETASTLTLGWRDRARGETRYRLRFRRSIASSWSQVKLPRNARGFTLSGLTEGAGYLVQVRACRHRSCSRWSGLASGSTLATNFGLCHVFPTPSGSTGASLPGEDAWNQDVSGSPPDNAATAAIVPSFPANLHPDFGSDPTYGIPYMLVSGSQPKLPVNFRANGYDDDYGDQSDPGPYPIPPDAPVEGGASATGDRHVIVLDRDNCILYELYNADYSAGQWNASSGAVWNLGSNALRTDGWTSADAAGLPIFAGLVRYDEVAAGLIDHAIRVTFSPTRNAYVHPGSHCAGSTSSSNYPPMGMRFRLKPTYTPATPFTGQSAVVAAALKKYGMLVADNGGDWFITGSTDSRWDDEDLEQLKSIPGSAFEVVQSVAAPSMAGC